MNETLHTGVYGEYTESPPELPSERAEQTPLPYDELVRTKYQAIRSAVASEVHHSGFEGLSTDDITQEVLIRLLTHLKPLRRQKH
jgi:DNA-directed RNA polymerase specialized sigma24 family protein